MTLPPALTSEIFLEDARVLLRPFVPEDATGLKDQATETEIWKYMPTRIYTTDELDVWGKEVLENMGKGLRYTFTIVDKHNNKLAGSTSYGNISDADKRLEIGWTWLGKEFRGTGLNKHCKFLLLSFAFEVLQYERVELKTDLLNTRSRKAMLKIGATEEGVLRSHTQMHDGRRRDTIYYSILRNEWPLIKETIFQGFKKLP